jgi:signal transduction histidine kinase
MDSSTKMHDHVFDFSSEAQTPTSDNCKIVLNSMLFKDLLAEHIFWYCRFRWIVIGVLISFGISSFIDGLFNYLKLNPDLSWPFGIAGFAIIMNVFFKTHADRLQATGPAGSLLINMWTQIILDLLVLTLVVHFVGSLDSVISFAYLFHIVLSCIFFSRIQSLLVIAFSSILFITCVILEYTGIIPPSSIFRNTLLIYNTASNPQAIFVHIITILSIWYVVWYLVSYISSLVRERDYELCTTNQRLKEAQEEKTKHLLRLTHELKAPFAAIDANIQVIQKGHCGILPFKALELLERIAARSRKLGDVIQAMLQLENVQKMTAEVLNTESLDLSEIIKWCIGQVQATAEKHNVKIEANLQSVQVNANEDCMKMLFSNVISNAILYSHPNAYVSVECRPRIDSGPMVFVEDHGIGILPEKIDKIFDEYYRTDEAVSHNKNSNGLGLAIVKHVAQIHRLSIRVASTPNVGTRFEILFPCSLSPSAGK